MADLLRSACLAIAVLCAPGAAVAQSNGDRVDVGDFQLDGLPSQELSVGHCGLFLWSKSERPVFIVFASEQPAQATVRLNGKIRALKRTATAGEMVFGQFETQTFAGNGVTFQIDLTFDHAKPIQDGAVIKSGVLRSRNKQGFETLVPVGGMIGCKTAE
jgi:hypothetical protein